jgi:hypothetical protein
MSVCIPDKTSRTMTNGVKIATYKVNGINSRLEVLRRWLLDAGRRVTFSKEISDGSKIAGID